MGKRARIHSLSVPVDESRPWDEAVWAAGPQTPTNYEIWKVGDKYPPAQGERTREVILVNFGKHIESSQVALDWATGEHLRPASPRTALAVGEHCPNLHRDLGMDPMAVVSLVPCSFRGSQPVVNSWWVGQKRRADLRWFDGGWGGLFWFAFVRK